MLQRLCRHGYDDKAIVLGQLAQGQIDGAHIDVDDTATANSCQR